ncbi:hypothetical protein E3P92_02325 [Wallemia ichthyophaga]|uniref:Zn(2)-C6 fungal-type domain-containing protein n=1 Tax=Wallemia ichthyophaga TaxID=245174 RepID=A0A4T0IS52_WALIC|nr:hypothetical protein E3P98_01880 [Wallemia ichthyophaga]TIA91186.1 hypothetical protein E3P97_02190 [Wallemia ichthyophaga]TIB00283.1 hypothetical protein E3P95_01815 [Wallemia ichthyophaga]TIB01386.1 hypothetical protein E3P94_01769 [Wallemia ichthyophaga]TIB12586.1 hypothetical protein E3P90_02044 [Wallemia ichthyophaga]
MDEYNNLDLNNYLNNPNNNPNPIDKHRKRSSKACLHCRKIKSKCSRPNNAADGPCENCLNARVECIFQGATKKRGPPKGYIDSLSDKLGRLEVVLANLIELPGSTHVINSITQNDPITKDIVQGVLGAGLTGSGGFGGSAHSASSGPSAPSGPSPTLPADSSYIQSTHTQRRRLDDYPSFPNHSTQLPSITHIDDSIADSIGQLSIDENENIRYHGKASGLHLITNNRRHQQGIWNFPAPGIWPASHELKKLSQTEVVELSGAKLCLPDMQVQEKLIELYFSYVHPVLPIIHKSWFLQNFNLSQQSSPHNPDVPDESFPTLLLLCVFGVASRYSAVNNPDYPALWAAGTLYIERAREITHLDHPNSRLSSVQAFLLLTYRSVGLGDMKSAWMFLGHAVRMAEDLGLHRDVSHFHPNGRIRLSDVEVEARKRTWHGCVILDTYISSYIGRPTAIRGRDYDTRECKEDEIEETEAWMPIEAHVTCSRDACDLNDQDHPFNWTVPQTSYALSCFNHFSRLSALENSILEHCYSIKHGSGDSIGMLSELHQRVDQWSIDLPRHLKYTASSQHLPPPHVLTLHTAFHCTLILLHRPYVTTPSPYPSHQIMSMAANSITSIVNSLNTRHDFLNKAPSLLIYHIFTAGITHCFNLQYPDIAPVARRNLRRTMEALKAMVITWPAAGRAYDMLMDVYDIQRAEDEEGEREGEHGESSHEHAHAPGPRGIKRMLMESAEAQGVPIGVGWNDVFPCPTEPIQPQVPNRHPGVNVLSSELSDITADGIFPSPYFMGLEETQGETSGVVSGSGSQPVMQPHSHSHSHPNTHTHAQSRPSPPVMHLPNVQHLQHVQHLSHTPHTPHTPHLPVTHPTHLGQLHYSHAPAPLRSQGAQLYGDSAWQL